jgi:hypothetical protein
VWTVADIELGLDDEWSAGPVVTARIKTPAGELLIMAEIERYDRELMLSRLHIQSESLRPNSLGWARLRQIARAVAEKADVDVITVAGSARTSGAGHGRIPGQLRFTRSLPSAR